MKQIIIFWIVLIGIFLIMQSTYVNAYGIISQQIGLDTAAACSPQAGAGYARSQGIKVNITNYNYIAGVSVYVKTKTTGNTFILRLTNSTVPGNLSNYNESYFEINKTAANINAGAYNDFNITGVFPTLTPNAIYQVTMYSGDATNGYALCYGSNDYSEGVNGYAANADIYSPSGWTSDSATKQDFNIKIYFSNESNYTAPPPTAPTITLTTPINGTAQFYLNPNITANSSYANFGGVPNITYKLHNSTGHLLNSSTGTGNYSATFNNLPTGRYTLNATATNGTANAYSDNRTFFIYSILAGGITNPTAGQQVSSQFLNITTNTSSTTPSGTGVTITQLNYTLVNSTGSTLKSLQVSTNLSVYWNVYAENLSIGNYTITIKIQDSQGNNATASQAFSLITNALLNITLKNAVNGSIITTNTTINVTNLETNYLTIFNMSGGTYNLDIAKNTNYSFWINNQLYAYKTSNLTTGNNNQEYTNITLYTNNSVSINIYDEDTNALITSNISITLAGGTTTTYTTTSGIIYIDNIPDGSYTVSLVGGNYTLKIYTITVASRSTQTLNAYLTTSISTVIFSTQDFDSGASLPGATYVQTRQINGTWVLIDTRQADITGRVQFSYQQNVNYNFTVSLNGYTSEQFSLNPIIFNSYTIRLHKITTLSNLNTPQGINVIITYSPTEFYNNGTIQSFTWQISDTTGSITAYNLTTTTINGAQTTNGNNAYGQQISHNLNFTGSGLLDTLNITYCYDTTITSTKCFNYNYYIIGTYATTSFKANKDQTYGLGLFERAFLVTLIVIVISGIAFMVGGVIAGLPLAMLLLGYFYLTGFISLWMILPSILIGSILLFGRQE